MKYTPTLPQRCCHEYVEYLREMGTPPGRLQWVGKHLFAHCGRSGGVAFFVTRKKKPEKIEGQWKDVWVKAYRSQRLKVPRVYLDDSEFLEQALAEALKSTPVASASKSDVSLATGLPCPCLCGFETKFVRDILAYRSFAGECLICNAMVGPNLLLSSGMEAEYHAAMQERQIQIDWTRTNRRDIWWMIRIPDEEI